MSFNDDKFLVSFKANLDNICRAVKNRDIALVKAKRVSDGAIVAVLCAMSHESDEEVLFVPLAEMIDCGTVNPFVAYEPIQDPAPLCEDVSPN